MRLKDYTIPASDWSGEWIAGDTLIFDDSPWWRRERPFLFYPEEVVTVRHSVKGTEVTMEFGETSYEMRQYRGRHGHISQLLGGSWNT
jgi:hypothetical protein